MKNKFKELWGKNKVLIILGLILICCLVAIIIVSISFFFGKGKSIEGDRIKDISKYPITETFKSDFVTSVEGNESVKSATLEVKSNRRTVYVVINFKDDTSLNDAEGIAQASLSNISEDLLGYYDFEYILKCEKTENSDGFTTMGAKNVAGSGLVWNNNTPVESEE